MKATFAMVVLGIGLLLGAVPPVAAHHGFAAEYDATKPVTLTGTVAMVEWRNPHTWIHVDVKGPDGKVVRWRVEGGAPNAMYRNGWKKDSVAIGSVLTVQGFLAKDGSPTANGNTVKLPDGRVLGAASSGGRQGGGGY